MTAGEWRRGTACVSHLQTRELKSTHQVKMPFDLLPPHDPRVPGRPVTFFCFFSAGVLKPAGGHVVLVEERQDGVEFTPLYR